MREISEKFVKKCKDDKMKGIFRGIFISLALLAGSGLRGVVYHFGVYRFAAYGIEAQEYAGAGPVPAISACGPKG